MKAMQRVPALRGGQPGDLAANGGWSDRIFLRRRLDETENRTQQAVNPGNVGLSEDQKEELERTEPGAASFIRQYVGSDGFINGERTWILALQNATPSQLRAMPQVRDRLRVVSEKRAKSKRKGTQNIAEFPTEYNVTVMPRGPFLVVPKVSSERRQYIPIAYMEPPTIPSDLVFIIEDAQPHIFGIVTSRMHMAWLTYIGGKLKSDPRYSIGLVYNQFPWPLLTERDIGNISRLANDVLAARRAHPGETLAALYDPDAMPPDLRRAHRALDAAVDRVYRKLNRNRPSWRGSILCPMRCSISGASIRAPVFA